ncbi:MAG: hypothetical protein LBC04_00375, partial [Holosporaceae bacterium]|nr:hypothetical protein [Holosporaceae bacterium]
MTILLQILFDISRYKLSLRTHGDCGLKLICRQYVAVTAFVRTSNGDEWGKRIEFENLSGEICAVDVPSSAFFPRNRALRI